MYLSRNFNKLFMEPDERSLDWDNKLFEYGKREDIRKLEEHLSMANELYIDERQIYTAINAFTLETESKEEKMRLLKGLEKEDFVENLTITDTSVIIKTKNGEIRAIKLTGMIPFLNKEDKDIETERRKGQCHSKSIKISKSLGMPNDVVTGYIFGHSDKAKYLHSWVEFCYEEEEMVIDYTLNVLMNKAGYYQIQHAIPLNRISDENIRKDFEILKKINKLDVFNIKEYLVFRDEIMKDLEKNKRILDEER